MVMIGNLWNFTALLFKLPRSAALYLSLSSPSPLCAAAAGPETAAAVWRRESSQIS